MCSLAVPVPSRPHVAAPPRRNVMSDRYQDVIHTPIGKHALPASRPAQPRAVGALRGRTPGDHGHCVARGGQPGQAWARRPPPPSTTWASTTSARSTGPRTTRRSSSMRPVSAQRTDSVSFSASSHRSCGASSPTHASSCSAAFLSSSSQSTPMSPNGHSKDSRGPSERRSAEDPRFSLCKSPTRRAALWPRRWDSCSRPSRHTCPGKSSGSGRPARASRPRTARG